MENEEQDVQDVEVQEESSIDSQESTDEAVNYQQLYEEEKRKTTKLKRKLYSKKDDDEPQITNRSDSSWKARMELKVDGYNEDETDFILRNGGRDSLKNPFISSAIETMREKKKAEAAMVDVGPKSESERRYAPEEFAKLSADEQLKVLSSLK